MCGVKECTVCHEEKPATAEYFVRSSRCKSGIGSRCRCCHNKESRGRYERNPSYHREYYSRPENRARANASQARYMSKGKETELGAAIFKVRITTTVSLKRKTSRTDTQAFKILGCTCKFLREHIEAQFRDGMSWDRRSEWHIDHIIPLSSAKTPEEVYQLAKYTNLRPLWATENLKKGRQLGI